jgi:hypothetical protein
MAGTWNRDGAMMIGMVLRRPLFVSVRVYEERRTVFLPAASPGIGL